MKAFERFQDRTFDLLVTLAVVIMVVGVAMIQYWLVERERRLVRAECEVECVTKWHVPCWNCGAIPDVKPMEVRSLDE